MALMNFMVDSQRMVLGFYTFPTVFSAYSYGRRHATLTAFASVLMVVLFTYFNPAGLEQAVSSTEFIPRQWLDITVWGGTLVVIGYLMGTLYEHQERHLQDLRETYNGALMILRHFISKDKYTENHSYRVSVYATKIAASMRLHTERIEDLLAAALLHDIGKLDISRDLLYKAARLTAEEFDEIKTHVNKGSGCSSRLAGRCAESCRSSCRTTTSSTVAATIRPPARRSPWRRALLAWPTSTIH